MHPVVRVELADRAAATSDPRWITAIEAGQVLHFPRLAFRLEGAEPALLRAAARPRLSQRTAEPGRRA